MKLIRNISSCRGIPCVGDYIYLTINDATKWYTIQEVEKCFGMCRESCGVPCRGYCVVSYDGGDRFLLCLFAGRILKYDYRYVDGRRGCYVYYYKGTDMTTIKERR